MTVAIRNYVGDRKLTASSNSLEGITNLANRFYAGCLKRIELQSEPTDFMVYKLFNSTKELNSLIVFNGKRYRFYV